MSLEVGETRVPGENLRRHGENMQTPHRKAPPCPRSVIIYIDVGNNMYNNLRVTSAYSEVYLPRSMSKFLGFFQRKINVF